MQEVRTSTRADRIIAVILTVAVFFLSLTGTTDRPFWGDDYAAYISEGIAIAEGRFEEQKAVNFRMHPTDLKNRNVLDKQELVYAWGYPLLIAAVYAVFGYDTEGFGSMIFYRAIPAGFFALFAGMFFLWCRRRFSLAGALVLAVFVGTCRVLYGSIGSYYSDIIFVSLSTISFFLTERYFIAKRGKGRAVLGILLGMAVFLAWEMRTNGFSVGVCCVLGLVLAAFGKKQWALREKLTVVLLPVMAFLVPFIVLEGFVFGPATVEGASFCGFPVFFKNMKYAFYTLKDWIASSLVFRSTPLSGMPGFVMKWAAYAFLAIAAVGFFEVLVKEEPHIALFLVGNVIGISVLPYAADQGGRYHYFLLPYTVFCFGCGVRFLARRLKKYRLKQMLRPVSRRVCAVVPVILYCVAALTVTAFRKADMVSNADCAYSEAAVSMYGYIREHTEPDCTILTQKPRVLRLNTGRDCIAVANGHGPEETDYLLDIHMTYNSTTVPKELITSIEKEPVYSVGNLTLYRING